MYLNTENLDKNLTPPVNYSLLCIPVFVPLLTLMYLTYDKDLIKDSVNNKNNSMF